MRIHSLLTSLFRSFRHFLIFRLRFWIYQHGEIHFCEVPYCEEMALPVSTIRRSGDPQRIVNQSEEDWRSSIHRYRSARYTHSKQRLHEFRPRGESRRFFRLVETHQRSCAHCSFYSLPLTKMHVKYFRIHLDSLLSFLQLHVSFLSYVRLQ